MAGGTVKYSIVADAKPFVDATAQASKELQKLTEQAVGSAGSLGSIAAAAGPMGKALAVATGVGLAGFAALAAAITDSVKGLVETGGKLADLSAQTGISTQALQKLAYAGSLVGVSQEQITGAAVKMEKALANGDDVFRRLGLSFQKLRDMQPDQAFAAVAAQIARIKDPANQAAAAMEVFGKSGATLLPLIKSDLKAAGEEAERLGIILSGRTVDAADALGDEATKLAAAWEGVKNQFAAAIIENPKLLEGLRGLVTMMGELAQAMVRNKDLISGWVSSFVGGIQEIGKAFSAIATNPVFQKLVMGGAGMMANFLQLPGLASAAGILGASGPSAGSGTGHMAPGSSYAAISGGGVDFQAKGSAAAAAAAQKAAAAAAKAWTDSAEKSRQANDRFVADYKNGAYQQMLGIENLFDKRAKASTKQQDAELKAAQDHMALLDKLGEQNEAIFAAAQAKKVEDLRAVAGAIASLGDEIGGIGGAWAGFAAHGVAAFANLKDEALQSASLWQKVTIAIEGAAAAYGAGKAAGSPGKGALAGAGKGAAAGAAFGPYGIAIGAVAGAAIGFFGGRKAQKEELNALRAEFSALEVQAHKTGLVLDHAFNLSNAKQYKAAIQELQHALDIQGESQEKLNDAVQRYGFTIDELGPVMQRQELDKQAGQLYQDWQLLNQAGIDHNAIIERMSPTINEYVQNAIAAGGEIPAAMKPIIDDLIAQGALLDENGNAYTSAEAAGITYAQTMSQMFQDLIKHVEELVNAIRGVPDKTATITVRTIREGGGGGGDDSGGDDGSGGRNGETRGYASGGVFEPRPGGHVIRVAEGGQAEAVLNPGQMAAMAGGSPEALRELREMNAGLRRMPSQTALAIRDVIMMGR